MASFSFLTSTMASFSLSCVNLGYVAKQRRRKNGQYRLAFYQEQNEILETIKNAEELVLAERMMILQNQRTGSGSSAIASGSCA